jgi:hypothetical protein
LEAGSNSKHQQQHTSATTTITRIQEAAAASLTLVCWHSNRQINGVTNSEPSDDAVAPKQKQQAHQPTTTTEAAAAVAEKVDILKAQKSRGRWTYRVECHETPQATLVHSLQLPHGARTHARTHLI